MPMLVKNWDIHSLKITLAYDSVPRDFNLRSILRTETFNSNQTEYRIFVGHFGKNINATMKDSLKQELWDNNDTVLGPDFQLRPDFLDFQYDSYESFYHQS